MKIVGGILGVLGGLMALGAAVLGFEVARIEALSGPMVHAGFAALAGLVGLAATFAAGRRPLWAAGGRIAAAIAVVLALTYVAIPAGGLLFLSAMASLIGYRRAVLRPGHERGPAAPRIFSPVGTENRDTAKEVDAVIKTR